MVKTTQNTYLDEKRFRFYLTFYEIYSQINFNKNQNRFINNNLSVETF